MSVKNYVPEVIRFFHASNGTLSNTDLKIILLNEEATVALNVEINMKGENCKAATKKDVDKHKMLICCRCGKPNHTRKECTYKAYICCNCKELTINILIVLRNML